VYASPSGSEEVGKLYVRGIPVMTVYVISVEEKDGG